jgi:hypothetical protein
MWATLGAPPVAVLGSDRIARRRHLYDYTDHVLPLCDLQGYADLISPSCCFASHRSDLGSFVRLVGKILYSMLRNPSEGSLGT